MGENWIGKAVSIKCVDDFGVFQGIIKDANSSKIVISQAFRNGLPIKTLDTEVTIMYVLLVSSPKTLKFDFFAIYFSLSFIAYSGQRIL